MKELNKTFWDWIDTRAIIRRTVLLATLWMTWHTYLWATSYAAVFYKGDNGADLALVIGAVVAPIMALQGFVFKIYTDKAE